MNRPYVLIKTAMSADGKIALPTRKRIRLSNELDRETVDKLRSQYDAILVGETTLKRDNPRLVLKSQRYQNARLRRGLKADPSKVTISKKCDLNTSTNFFTSGNATKFVFITEQASRKNIETVKKKADVFVVGKKRVDLKRMLAILYEHGVRSLMVEGGGSVNFEFFKENLVDELRVAIAPKIVGGYSSPTLVDGKGFSELEIKTLKLKSVRKLGEVIVLNYTVISPNES